jgi:RNA polymerase sigma-70 factor (ECF subfamily)
MNALNQTNEWITGFRRGDLQAVRDLFQAHFSSLLIFSERVIRDQHEAREIVTETFIKLLNRRLYFEDQADIKAFLYITTRNACMDFLRSVRNGRVPESSFPELRESEEDFGDEAVRIKATQVLQSTIENLPIICRQVYRAIFVEGMPTTAAARLLGTDQRDLLNERKKCMHELRAALLDQSLFNTAFFVHFLAVAGRIHMPEEKAYVTVNR